MVLAVATSAHASVAIPRDEGTLSRGLRTPPLPADRGGFSLYRCGHMVPSNVGHEFACSTRKGRQPFALVWELYHASPTSTTHRLGPDSPHPSSPSLQAPSLRLGPLVLRYGPGRVLHADCGGSQAVRLARLPFLHHPCPAQRMVSRGRRQVGESATRTRSHHLLRPALALDPQRLVGASPGAGPGCDHLGRSFHCPVGLCRLSGQRYPRRLEAGCA